MPLRPGLLRAIRPMADADLPRVAAIEAATFPNPWPVEALAHEHRENPHCHSFVAEEEAGRTVAAYAFLWVIFDEAHLINIAVAREFRGRGYGEAMLVHLLRFARAQGARRIHLEVRESNAPAIALYGKYGFQILGRAEKYYTDGAAALFMEASLEVAAR
jgi:ribosomal-protein-alanine N-acetyltransferase